MNKNYLVIIFLLLGPILDVSNFLGFPFSIIIRGLYLVLITYNILKNKVNFNTTIPLLLYCAVIFLYQYIFLKLGIFTIASSILKFLYLPLSIIYLKNYEFKINKNKILTTIIFTYIGIFIISYIFGLGANAYLDTDGKTGFKSLFTSINEFSAIIVGLLPIVTTYLKKQKKYLLLTTVLLGSFICSLLVGTKVLLGGVIFVCLYLLYQERQKIFCNKSKQIKTVIILSAVVLSVLGIFTFTKTRTFNNMVVQNDFFKVEKVLSYEFLNKIIYNDRLSFLEDNYNHFKIQNSFSKLLGIGYNSNYSKMVEIDIFDTLFRFGIIGFILFTYSMINTINVHKMKQESKISFFLLIIISLTSGHVLIYPAVSIYFACL